MANLENPVFPTRPELYRGCYVRHFKHELRSESEKQNYPNKDVYQIFNIGLHTETNEKLVIYINEETGAVFCRPVEMFVSEVDKEKYPQITQKYRLELYKP